MILIRDKYYSRRDPTPPPFPFSDEMLEYLLNDPNATVIFNVEGKDRKNDKVFNEHFGKDEKKYIKRLEDDLAKGYYSMDGDVGEDTHYLKDFSNKNRYQRFSKSINPIDRLVYIVYPPEMIEGKPTIKIVIQNYIGHKAGDKYYSSPD